MKQTACFHSYHYTCNAEAVTARIQFFFCQLFDHKLWCIWSVVWYFLHFRALFWQNEVLFVKQCSYRNRKTKFQDFSRTFYIFFPGFIFRRQQLTLYCLYAGFFPFGTVNTFPLRAHCFCLISAPHIVSARYFRFCLSRFPLCKVSLPAAFESDYMYLNRIE